MLLFLDTMTNLIEEEDAMATMEVERSRSEWLDALVPVLMSAHYWSMRVAEKEARRLLREGPAAVAAALREAETYDVSPESVVTVEPEEPPVLVLLEGGRREPMVEEPALTLLDLTKRRITDRVGQGGEVERDVRFLIQHHLDRYGAGDAAELEAFTEAALAPLREPVHELPEDPEQVPFDDVVRIGRSIERMACPPDEAAPTVRAMLRTADRTLELPTRRARRLPRLTPEQVKVVLERSEWKRGAKKALAAELGVSAEAISKVVRGISHRELEEVR